MKEHLLSVNNFNKPDSFSGLNADAVMLLNALNGRAESGVTNGPRFELRRFRFDDLDKVQTELPSELKTFAQEHLHITLDDLKLLRREDGSIALVINIVGKMNKKSPIVFLIKEEKDGLLIDFMKK